MKYLESLKFTHEFWTILMPSLLIAIDVLTGVVNAWIKRELSSSTMRKGLGHKVSEFAYLLVGFLCSEAFALKQIYYFISFYIIYMEILSIVENCKKLGTKEPIKIDKELDNISKQFKVK